MADLNFQINVGGNAPEALGSLKKQLREAQAEVSILSDKFGATSQEAINAAKRAAELKDRIGDAKALTEAFNPDAKFKAFSQTLGAVAGGFSAVQGAIGLLGAEGKEVEKTLLKVQSALALSQGLEQLGDLGDAFKNLKAVAVNAFNGIKAAIGSTGIGLLVIALGAIYAYWEDIKEVVSGVSEEQKNLNKQSQENLDLQKKKLDAIGEQDNILKLQGKSEKDILKLKIAQSDEAIKAAEINLANSKATRDAQVAAAKRNQEILQGLIRFVSAPITLLLSSIDSIGKAFGKNFNLEQGFSGGLSKFIFDPEETAKEGDAAIAEAQKTLTTLKNNRAGYQLAVQNIDKEGAKKSSDAQKQRLQDAEEAIKKELELEKKRRDEVLDIQSQIDSIKNKSELIGLSEKDKRLLQLQQELDANLIKYKDNLDARQKAYILYEEGVKAANLQTKEEEKKEEEKNNQTFLDNLGKRATATIGIAETTIATNQNIAKSKQALSDLEKQKIEEQNALAIQSLDILSGLVDKNSVAGKAIAVSQAIINTYQGASKALAQGGIFGPVAAAATIAAGLVNVNKIISTKIPSAKGSGDVGGGGSASLSSAAPISPEIPQAATTNLSSSTINALGNQAIKAYVVETDVTSNQQRVKAIQQRARFD